MKRPMAWVGLSFFSALILFCILRPVGRNRGRACIPLPSVAVFMHSKGAQGAVA